HLRLDDEVPAPIRQPDGQGAHAVLEVDDHVARELEPRHRDGELREDDAGGERDHDDGGDRFRRDRHVRGPRLRVHPAVSGGAEPPGRGASSARTAWQVKLCVAAAEAAWRRRYLLSVALLTSFFASFFMWRASFFALRIFRFARRLVFAAPLSVCSVSLTLSV